jgi:hypothetical protein
MSDDTQRTLLALLATLADNLTELDHTLYRLQGDARTELMLTVRQLVALHDDRFSN